MASSRRSLGKDNEAAMSELKERLAEAEKEVLEAQEEAAEYGDKLTAQMEKNKALASRVQQLELRLSEKRTGTIATIDFVSLFRWDSLCVRSCSRWCEDTLTARCAG